jgi:hypothetical protein
MSHWPKPNTGSPARMKASTTARNVARTEVISLTTFDGSLTGV